VIGDTIEFTVKGKFVKKTKAVGTYDVDGEGCSDKQREFVAERRGAAA